MQHEGLDKINYTLAQVAGWTQLPPGKKHYHFEYGTKVMDWVPPGEGPDSAVTYRSYPNYVNDTKRCIEELGILCLRWSASFVNGLCAVKVELPTGKGEALDETFSKAFAIAIFRAL